MPRPSRPLTPGEVALARPVFGDAIAYDRVRVNHHKWIFFQPRGVVTMKPLLRADVPAKGELVFKQGGKHLMIWGINGAAVRAGKLPMAFVFTNNNNERILFDMVIKPAEGAAAGEMDHGAMDHGSMDAATEKGAEKAAPDAAKK